MMGLQLRCWFLCGSPPLGGDLWCPTRYTFLRRLWIGCGSPGGTQALSSGAERRGAGKYSRPIGQLWPSGLISHRVGIAEGPHSVIGAYTEVVLPAGASLGTASGVGRDTGWAHLDVNRMDPVELALAADLQRSALAHVATSSCNKYTSQWNMFVRWCGSLKEPRVTLPASDSSVAMYLHSVMNNAKTSGLVKAASAAIAFYQKINLFAHEPSPAVCIVRSAAMRKFGLNAKNRKEPFEWDDVVCFAVAYGVRQQGYRHLVVATMAVLIFGGICHYDDVSGLQWRNARFQEDRIAYE